MLNMSLASTSEEAAKMKGEISSTENKLAMLEKSIMTLHTKIKELRDEIINHASQQKTIEKSSSNLLKQTNIKYQSISNKEIEIAEIANEISRVKIDVLNATQQNEILKQKLKQLKDDQDKKDKDVSNLEGEIKKKHIKIQKKQHTVDRLNKELGELSKSGQNENTGPLDVQKFKLNGEIKSTQE